MGATPLEGHDGRVEHGERGEQGGVLERADQAPARRAPRGRGARRPRRRRSPVPPSGLVNPPSSSKVVVLPAPFGPMSPTISPARTSSDTPSTAMHAAEGLRQAEAREQHPPGATAGRRGRRRRRTTEGAPAGRSRRRPPRRHRRRRRPHRPQDGAVVVEPGPSGQVAGDRGAADRAAWDRPPGKANEDEQQPSCVAARPAESRGTKAGMPMTKSDPEERADQQSTCRRSRPSPRRRCWRSPGRSRAPRLAKAWRVGGAADAGHEAGQPRSPGASPCGPRR